MAVLAFPIGLWAQTKGLVPLSTHDVASGEHTYALVIGISDYQDPAIPDLRFADRDAEAFAAFLQSPARGSLDPDHLTLLTNARATGAQIAKELLADRDHAHRRR